MTTGDPGAGTPPPDAGAARPDAVPARGAAVAALESLRPLLFSIAYRMLSSVTDAEDVVQEASIRYLRAVDGGAQVDSPKAYLSAVVTRLAIDELRSARVRRETYVGQWLPEPLVTDAGADDPAEHAARADSLSMAFLLLLERLSPVERAVYLLHDIFDYGYAEIAAIVGKSEGNCRVLALRARQHLETGKPRFDVSSEKRDQLGDRFFAAVSGGDVNGLVEMLASDVVVYGDGGGKAPQWTRPVVGAQNTAQLLAGVGRKIAEVGGYLEACELNGQTGALVRAPDGKLVHVLVLDVVDGVVQAVRSVINPDKLQHLGPVADVYELRRDRSE